jgi:superfamily II DNA or RNA helicase
MENILANKIIKDFDDILGIKNNLNLSTFLNYNLNLNYPLELKILLYSETDFCLEIFNKFIKEIIQKYIDEQISIDELQEHTNWFFRYADNNRKEMYNEIFPKFIKLLIDNKNLMDKEKMEVIIVKKCLKSINDDDLNVKNISNQKINIKNEYNNNIIISEIDTEIEYDNNDNDNDETLISETESEMKDVNNNEIIINKLELIHYDKKNDPFDFRDNQKDAINKTIEQDFKSGIHCQIMGAGKTFTMLNIAQQHYLKYQQNLIYMIITDRIDILKSWFMINLTEVIQNDYKKKYNNNAVDSDEYKTYESLRLKSYEYYKYKKNNNYFIFNYSRFEKWTNDKIIDMSVFEPRENIINKNKNKNKNTLEKLNTKLNKPILWICNNGFLKKIYKNINLNNIGLIFVDECHSISGNENYNMLTYFRNNNINIQGFSATPLRPIKHAEDNLLKVYGTDPSNKVTNKVNVISNYDMIKALKDGIILPFVHTIITPETDKKSLKINSLNKQELTLKKIIETYFINNINLPYKKGVAWVNKISKIAKNKGTYYIEIKKLCDANNIQLFVSYSGTKTYPEINELSTFEECPSNALLLCVNRVKEGSDIKNLDCGIFLDAVKKRSIVSSLQSIGRILRPDEAKLKKSAYIYESVKIDENKTIENLSVNTVLNYYKKILNISNITADIDYISKIQELFDDTQIINEDGKKSIHIIIDEEKDIKCKINLNIKEIDWRIFQNSLRKELSTKLHIEEDKLLERDFIKLKYSNKNMDFTTKDEYKIYATKYKLEENPEIKYEKWWIGWYDFLNIDIANYPKTKEELINKCKINGINVINYHENVDKYILPKMPEELYPTFGTLDNELSANIISRRK